MKNEWDLFLVVRTRLDAGEGEVSFDILEPAMWTIFSRRPARVQDADGTQYELSPGFPAVLHEFIRVHIASRLDYALDGDYRLYFQPDRRHPCYDPAAAAIEEARWPTSAAFSASPEALRQLLDRLPPPPPAGNDDDEIDQ